jgi:high affinity choline transporter 7
VLLSPGHPARPTLILLVLLGIAGLLLYAFGNGQVFWPGYLSMMVFYGVIFYAGAWSAVRWREQPDFNGVLLAGRSLPLWMAVFTMGATWVGGGYINGTAENTAAPGFGLVWVQAPWGYALSLVVGGLFFAGPMRRNQYRTMLDPLEQRFGKRMSALLFVPALMGELFWTAAILTALGTTFGTVLGIATAPAIVLSAAIALAYTALGGLWAVAVTDVLQLGLLLVGLFLVVPFAMEAVGGWDASWALYQKEMGPAASFLPSEAALGDYYWVWWDYALLLIFGGIPWQVYFQRVLAARDERTARNLSFLAAGVCLLAAVPAVLIGIAGFAASSTGHEAFPPPDAASTLPWVIRHLCHPVVATIGLGAVAAAVMSSVDSSILSASSMAGWNVWRPLFRPHIDPAGLQRVLRRSIWILGTAATLLALKIQSVYQLWFLCSDLVYCLLFPALVVALFDPKANTAGVLSGFLLALFLRLGGGEPSLGLPGFLPYPSLEDGSTIFPFRTLAMLSGLICMVVVSRRSF